MAGIEVPHYQILTLDNRFENELPDRSTDLPQGVVAALHEYPAIRPLVAEFSLSDQTTFYHSCLMCEHSNRLAHEYAQASSLPLWLHTQLRKYLHGTLFHDIGKTLLVPRDPIQSEALVNRVHENNGNNAGRNGNNGDYFDDRILDDQVMHRMHPLLGGLAVRMLPEIMDIDPHLTCEWAEIAFSHHERDKDLTQSQVLDVRKYPSYPRGGNRSHRDLSMMKVTKFITQIADASVSMGFPRVHRRYRLKDETIFSVLSQNVIREPRMRDVFGDFSEGQLLQARVFFIQKAFEVLHALQSEHENDDNVLMPGVMLMSGESLATPNDTKLRTLTQLSSQVWVRHQQRIGQEIGRMLQEV